MSRQVPADPQLSTTTSMGFIANLDNTLDHIKMLNDTQLASWLAKQLGQKNINFSKEVTAYLLDKAKCTGNSRLKRLDIAVKYLSSNPITEQDQQILKLVHEDEMADVLLVLFIIKTDSKCGLFQELLGKNHPQAIAAIPFMWDLIDHNFQHELIEKLVSILENEKEQITKRIKNIEEVSEEVSNETDPEKLHLHLINTVGEIYPKLEKTQKINIFNAIIGLTRSDDKRVITLLYEVLYRLKPHFDSEQNQLVNGILLLWLSYFFYFPSDPTVEWRATGKQKYVEIHKNFIKDFKTIYPESSNLVWTTTMNLALHCQSSIGKNTKTALSFLHAIWSYLDNPLKSKIANIIARFLQPKYAANFCNFIIPILRSYIIITYDSQPVVTEMKELMQSLLNFAFPDGNDAKTINIKEIFKENNHRIDEVNALALLLSFHSSAQKKNQHNYLKSTRRGR